MGSSKATSRRPDPAATRAYIVDMAVQLADMAASIGDQHMVECLLAAAALQPPKACGDGDGTRPKRA